MNDSSYQQILDAARVLFQPGDVVEVRVPKARQEKTISGYFDDLELLARSVAELEARKRYQGIYWTLNPVAPALLARAANKVLPFAEHTTNDGDIVRRHHLPVDLDARRPAGISSSDAEHDAALALSESLPAALLAEGWPEPVRTDSGNGAHLLYTIDLPNDEESAKLIERVLQALAARFDNPMVQVDKTLFNASRILKIYGTTARKGDNTADRPHRVSRLLAVPALLTTVPVELLRALASTAPDPARKRTPAPDRKRYTGGSSFPQFDLPAFLSRHGLLHRAPVAHEGGLKYVLEACPFDGSHHAPDAAVFERADGQLAFKCFHNSCVDRGWKDVRELFEPRTSRQHHAPAPRDRRDEISGAAAAAEPGEGSPPADEGPIEIPLSAADVEAAVGVACAAQDWEAIIRLVSDIAKVTLASYTLIVGKLRKHFKRDFPAAEFKALVREARAAQAPPPVDLDEDPPEDGPDLIGAIPLTDSGNGERLVLMCGDDIRFCPEFKKWMLWDGRRWVVDTDAGVVTQKAKAVARALYEQAKRLGDDKLRTRIQAHARDSESQGAITAALNRAKSEPGMSIGAGDLDQHRYLLNFMNGVVDTRTGEMLPFKREYYITKLCHFEYDAESKAEKDCPRFLKYLHWTMGETPDMGELPERVTRMVAFLQKAFGYALTGDVSEKAAFIFYGARGNNGKTTLLTLFTTLLSEYSTQLDINTLMTSKFTDNNVRADLARLHGARFVITSEVDDGQRLSERLMKYLTSGMGKITACRKFENPFEFISTHKIFMDCNYRPEVKGADEAIWSRLKCVPFLQRIEANDPSINKQLIDTLLAEAKGIIAWTVRGTIRWWSEKSLGDPIEVKEAGVEWREADDPLKPFLEECCELGGDYWVRCKDFTKAYQIWCKDNNEMQLKSSRLTQRLALKGIEENRSKRVGDGGTQVRCWQGARLREDVTLISAPRGGEERHF